MKPILSAALVLGVCGLTCREENKADPVGTWKCEYEIGGQERAATLTLKKDGDKLVGTMSWPDQKEILLKDVKLTDGNVTFSVVRKLMGREIPCEYKLRFAGDKFKGKGSSEFGGQKNEWDIEGKREKEPDSTDKAKSPTPAQELTDLIKRIDKDQKEFDKAYMAAKTDNERKKVGVNPNAYAPDFFLTFMKKYANDPQAVRCFGMMFAKFPSHPATDQAADIIIQNQIQHVQGAWLGPYCLFLGVASSPAALKVLEAALEKNKSKEAQGYARYGLAKYYMNQADNAGPGMRLQVSVRPTGPRSYLQKWWKSTPTLISMERKSARRLPVNCLKCAISRSVKLRPKSKGRT